MRDFFNNILAFIDAESLTDIEFDSMTAVLPLYDQETYDNLYAVLSGRDLVSNTIERLGAYYLAKGFDAGPAKKSASNIFIGSSI